MRRTIGLTATGLGTFFVVIGLLLHFVVVGEVVKFPLNNYLISTLIGHNVSYFSPSKLTEVSGVTMRVTDTTQGDVSVGTSSRTVWNEFSYLYDVTNRVTYQYSTERLAFDRRTGVLISNCCGDAIGTNTSPHLSGQGFLWPINTQKQTYQVFDSTLLTPEPATYQGTANIGGILTYKFVEQVPATKYGTQTVPGSLVGSSQSNVTLDQYYQATNTTWVDPKIGAPVQVDHNQQITLRDSTGAVRLNLFSGDLTFTPATLAASVKADKGYDSKVDLITTTVPLILVLVGAVLVLVGVVLALLPSRREEDEYEADEEYESAPLS